MHVPDLIETVELKPAPEPLLAVQALLDTRVRLRGEERLTDPAAASEWLERAGLLAGGAVLSEHDLGALIEFRESVRAAIETRDGLPRTGGPTADIAAIAERHRVAVGFGGGEPELELAPAADVDELISQLLGIALSAAAREEWRRLKLCAADDCRWAYYDRAKNRSGAWCSMDTCGNRAKARAHRARAARPGAGEPAHGDREAL